ncbi:MAG: type I-D CRISPR-associated helicase Cas3', partial [Gloeomargarita sp. SKYBB_i_bin120]|nr:type I-D CRISPR-associated helicase Cas3' [Gloeomargarita sp. SKYB120]MDW8178992.1 type I-D CRISPR-associated helicase Cas3' [Gloeomargarita sp. SKYBB_i_bin120]
MRVFVQPLYVQLNTGVGDCPLGCAHGCQVVAQAPKLASLAGGSCPLLRHQADTWAALRDGNADVLFNTAPTGAGKTLAGCGLSLVQPGWRLVSCYPTNELIEDQARSLRHWHEWFELDYDRRVLPLYGERLSQQVEQQDSSRFLVLTGAIQNYPLLLTNPDLLHYMVHFRYRDPAYGADLLPVALADFPDLWVFDEFHLFGPHQEAAVLNGMALIRRLRGEQRPRRFLFTSATPKPAFQVSLQQTGWTIQTIPCSCVSVPTDGYRPIAQGLELAFVQLERGQEALDWLLANAGLLRAHLQAEGAGRGLVLLNSVAQAAQAVSR